jgi:hypothetical protein
MGLQRVPEEDHKIDITLCGSRADLLVSSEGPALESRYLKAKLTGKEGTCCTRYADFMLFQNIQVEFCPL